MSLPILLLILVFLFILWHIFSMIEKLNAEKIKTSKNPFILKYKRQLETSKNTNTKLLFGKTNSDRRKKIVFFVLGTFAIGFYNFTNLDYDIINYNGIFLIIFFLILIISLIILFLIARNNYLSNKNEFILYRLFGFIATFVIGGIFFAFYVNIVLISSLNRVVFLFPKTEIIEKAKVLSKETSNHHGNNYKISAISVDEVNFSFNVNEKSFNRIHKGETIKVKYYKTKNKTIYVKYGENPYELNKNATQHKL